MRTIKFRVYDEKTKKYLNMASNVYILGSLINGVLAFGTEQGEIKNIIEQYTGLKDKNGVEIYEGDICIYDYDELIGVKHDLSKQGIVKFEQCAFRFELYNGLWIVLTLGEELKVIGNIHEER